MAQFDLYANTDKDTNRTYPYFVDIQNSLLDTLNSKVVIPLTPVGKSDKSSVSYTHLTLPTICSV